MHVLNSAPVERLPEQPWLLNTCVQADQRDQLARFWLAAPEDLLPSLWSSPVGEQLSPWWPDSSNALHSGTGGHPGCHWARLQHGFQAPMAVQLLLANFVLPTRFAHHCQCGGTAS